MSAISHAVLFFVFTELLKSAMVQTPIRVETVTILHPKISIEVITLTKGSIGTAAPAANITNRQRNQEDRRCNGHLATSICC